MSGKEEDSTFVYNQEVFEQMQEEYRKHGQEMLVDFPERLDQSWKNEEIQIEITLYDKGKPLAKKIITFPPYKELIRKQKEEEKP